ncbi:competence/damage-inducible protein A [Gordonia sp. HY442]|uniref:competence/damage-inducible protein A n=1 Tax=Gordonia zhenghanii TaxID=2911516 RepID=UPI001F28EDFD|nr:competence/damage-inducible protein A [Gordonia zhenghanii]MCF8601936.1 competence/damage-inducible protein A [Gordonia zhenghanii]MCF8602004.1 competence/damage-inducible protein A [Gordonia zhenghanii]
MSTRAGIVVTGTEVLSGWIADQNGPWVSQRLLELGVDVAHLTVCGDRPEDLLAQLRFLADQNVDVIVTTGGLGPTADDLTVATVAEFASRPVAHDAVTAQTIESVIRGWRKYADIDELPASTVASIEKQALVPEGAEAIPPTGTAPGVAVPGTDALPAVLVLPGPPRELRAMWPNALDTGAVTAALRNRVPNALETIRAFGLSEPDLAVSLADAEKTVDGFGSLEITTCMRGGELEISTRFAAEHSAAYDALSSFLLGRHGDRIYSTDEREIDDLLIERLAGRTIVTAESCTGGLVAARLTERAGSSAYMLGGVVSYSNDVKTGAIDVPADLIAEHGAVSEQVAAAMADGVAARLNADVAISTTGIAGPGGAVVGKPVGTVCIGIAVAGAETRTVTRSFPGNRQQVRELTVTTALHLAVQELAASPAD